MTAWEYSLLRGCAENTENQKTAPAADITRGIFALSD